MNRGISQMIGVVLAIGFTLIVAALIFNFSRGNVDEALEDVSSSEIESYCLLHVKLTVKDACFADNVVRFNVKNEGDSGVTENTAIRFTNGENSCFSNLFLPNSNGLGPFETSEFSVSCSFLPEYGELNPYVEIKGKSYSCGMKGKFSVVEC